VVKDSTQGYQGGRAMGNTQFIKPKDLVVIENQDEFILRKGFIHINEIIIDKKKSSCNFVNKFRSYIKDGKITLDKEEESHDDFMKLLKFGFLGIKSNDKFLVLLGLENEVLSEILIGKGIEVKYIDDFINRESQLIICNDKDVKKINEIRDKVRQKLEVYAHIYVLDEFANITQLRSLNRVFNALDQEVTIGFVDNDNIYLAAVKPHYTGCYECLENHILSKFPGRVADYESEYMATEVKSNDSLDPNFLILAGFIFKDMENIEKYGMSSLTGNVIHFYSPNFEYSYNANLKSSACNVCAGLNHVRFEEQNIRSINIIKEMAKDA
jgi:hypothetical protein